MKRVPAALHGELTEYASLLRALRTSHTLDLSTHLSQLPSNEVSDIDLSDEEHNSEPKDEILDEPLPSKKRKRPTNNDTWTRWPLLSGDVYHPEWDLSDEVELLISQIRQQRRASSSSSDTDLDIDEAEEVGTRALAASTVNHLRSILSVCSAHVPRVDPAMRGRLAPLNWTGVLAAAGASGFVPPEALARVRARLEALYAPQPSARVEGLSKAMQLVNPPSPALTRPSHAASAVNAARARLHSLLATRVEQGDGDILSFMGPLLSPDAAKRKRARRKKRKMKLESRGAPSKVEESVKTDDHGKQIEADRDVKIAGAKVDTS